MKEENFGSKDNAEFSNISKRVSYRLAHKIGNFILNISKQKGVSRIQPRIEQNALTSMFEVIVENLDRDKLKKFLSNKRFSKPTKKFFITRLIARVIAPFSPKHYSKDFSNNFDRIDFKKNCSNFRRLEVFMPKGISIDTMLIHSIKITPKTKSNKSNKSNEYILHCHGNGAVCPELTNYFQKYLSTFNMNVVLFDYPGYGLSLGETHTKKDLYESAFSVAKALIKCGATYILIDGVSLGGAVAAKTAVLLRDYCNKNDHIHVQIEHFNSLSFSSTPDYAVGAIREFNLIGKNAEKRSSPNIFEKFLGAVLSPIINLFLRLTDWNMNPKANIKRLPKNTYEIISAKGDLVMGTYASVEKQFRKRNLKEIVELKNERAKMQQEKDRLEKLPNNKGKERGSHSVRARKVDHPEKKYAASIENLKLKINQINKKIALKQNRLLSTDHTSDFIDGYADRENNPHSAQIFPLNNAVDNFCSFLKDRNDRKPKLRPLIRENKNKILNQEGIKKSMPDKIPENIIGLKGLEEYDEYFKKYDKYIEQEEQYMDTYKVSLT